MAFNVVTTREEESLDEKNSEGMTLINHRVRKIIRTRKQRTQGY